MVRKKSNWGFIDLDDPKAIKNNTSAHRFGRYKDHFLNLCNRTKVKTEYDINSITISNDETLAIVVFMVGFDEIMVSFYDL